jgi:proline iminopeptidase
MALISFASPAQSCHMRSAPAAGGNIAFRDCGHGNPVLIIPGGPGLDADYMYPLAQMIVSVHHRVLLLEPRGTGASRAALGDGSQLTVAGSVTDVETVRQAAGTNKITVIGHSFAGGVAQAYAAAHPDHVASLILLDSVGPGAQKPSIPTDIWRSRATPQELADYDADRTKGDRIAAMRLKFRIDFFHRDRGAAFVAALPDSAVHMDVMPLSTAYERDFHIAAGTRSTFPVTLIFGDIDFLRGYEQPLKATYPSAQSIIIPNAGHFPWVDSPSTARKALQKTRMRHLLETHCCLFPIPCSLLFLSTLCSTSKSRNRQ